MKAILLVIVLEDLNLVLDRAVFLEEEGILLEGDIILDVKILIEEIYQRASREVNLEIKEEIKIILVIDLVLEVYLGRIGLEAKLEIDLEVMIVDRYL